MSFSVSHENPDGQFLPVIKFYGKEIWRSKKAYPNIGESQRVASDKIHRTMTALFGGE